MPPNTVNASFPVGVLVSILRFRTRRPVSFRSRTWMILMRSATDLARQCGDYEESAFPCELQRCFKLGTNDNRGCRFLEILTRLRLQVPQAVTRRRGFGRSLRFWRRR